MKSFFTLGLVLLFVTDFFCQIPQIFIPEGYDLSKKEISIIREFEEVDKETLFNKINSAVALLYNKSSNVIRLNNREDGKLIIKGKSEVDFYRYQAFEWQNPEIPVLLLFNHTLEVDVKDNKYRIKLILDNIEQSLDESSVYNFVRSNLNCDLNEIIFLTEVSESKMLELAVWWQNESNKLHRKKYEQTIKNIKPRMIEFNNSILRILIGMELFIFDKVSEELDDDW